MNFDRSTAKLDIGLILEKKEDLPLHDSFSFIHGLLHTSSAVTDLYFSNEVFFQSVAGPRLTVESVIKSYRTERISYYSFEIWPLLNVMKLNQHC